MYKRWSSAKKRGSEWLTAAKSLIEAKMKSGPVPCGTPEIMSFCDEQLPSKSINLLCSLTLEGFYPLERLTSDSIAAEFVE